MKLLQLSTLLFLLCKDCFSQNIKSYSGAYENGTATYQYFENDKYERVYQGQFSYKSGYLSITGKFIEDKKDGTWKANNNKPNYGYSETVDGQFSKGNFEGTWTYKRTSNKTGKIIGTSVAHFKNNVRVGSYEHWRNDEHDNFSIKYNLNNKGLLDGEYKVTFQNSNGNGQKYEDLRKYKQGIMMFRIYRNLSTGDVIEKYDKTEIISKFFSFLDTTTQLAVIPRFNPKDGVFGGIPTSYSFEQKHLKSDATTGERYIENLPLKMEDGNIDALDSYWELLIATIFWDNREQNRYGGFYDNPIFKIARGSNETKFAPIRYIVYDESHDK